MDVKLSLLCAYLICDVKKLSRSLFLRQRQRGREREREKFIILKSYIRNWRSPRDSTGRGVVRVGEGGGLIATYRCANVPRIPWFLLLLFSRVCGAIFVSVLPRPLFRGTPATPLIGPTRKTHKQQFVGRTEGFDPTFPVNPNCLGKTTACCSVYSVLSKLQGFRGGGGIDLAGGERQFNAKMYVSAEIFRGGVVVVWGGESSP